ncbi:hypothetical protein ACFQIA_06525 [Halalkalicoccus sp. GCM10025704]
MSIMQRSLFGEMRELESRLEEQERRLTRLERHLRALDLCGAPCPRCANGEMLQDDDRLHCPACGYAHSL